MADILEPERPTMVGLWFQYRGEAAQVNWGSSPYRPAPSFKMPWFDIPVTVSHISAMSASAGFHLKLPRTGIKAAGY
jgi:hypothetical protein